MNKATDLDGLLNEFVDVRELSRHDDLQPVGDAAISRQPAEGREQFAFGPHIVRYRVHIVYELDVARLLLGTEASPEQNTEYDVGHRLVDDNARIGRLAIGSAEFVDESFDLGLNTCLHEAHSEAELLEDGQRQLLVVLETGVVRTKDDSCKQTTRASDRWLVEDMRFDITTKRLCIPWMCPLTGILVDAHGLRSSCLY